MKHMDFVYPATLTKRGGCVVVSFPDLPEALTEGADAQDAVQQAADCLDEAIAGRIRPGDDIPRPSPPGKRHRMVPVPASTAGKAAVYLAMREAGLTLPELAARLGCKATDLRRLLDPRRPPDFVRLQQVLSLLGKHLVVEVRAA
jgi:antitoxin HicB